MRRNRRPVGSAIVTAAVLVFAMTADALAQQSGDRERAQMLQLQQQLRRLEQDKTALESKAAKDGEELKKREAEGVTLRRDLARARGETNTKSQENDALRGELDASRQALAAARAQIETLQNDVTHRDEALNKAAQRQREDEQAQALLAERLKQQTARGDLCEVKHAQAMSLAASAIDSYAQQSLRLCEPFTGIWRVSKEERIQDFRERLYESRLDVTPAKAEKP